MTADRPAPHVARYDGLLGTVVELRVHADDHAAAHAAELAAVDTVRRLQAVFDVHDAASTLCRWRAGATDDTGAELAEVLALALAWHERSGGAFNPLTGALGERWRAAAATGAAPADGELAALAASIRAPRYRLVAGRPERTGDCTGLDLNAIAKGWIVDAALRRAAAVPGVRTVVVNAGGDLAHAGAGQVRVGVENPRRPFDNEPPLAVVTLAGAALATSGGARRGVRVAGRHHSHVLDPRTGRPVDHTLSATVRAGDAATADVLATVASVLPAGEALTFVDGVAGAACLLVDAAGAVRTSAGWSAVTA